MWITELSEEDLDQAAALEQDCFGSQAWSRTGRLPMRLSMRTRCISS